MPNTDNKESPIIQLTSDKSYTATKNDDCNKCNENYGKIRITKNVIVIGLAFMIHFTAFHGMSNLQSSVNSSAALGTSTLAVMYGSLILSNIFLPVTVIRWFGCKWTIAISFIAYMPFMIAQFYPRFCTFIPAALGVGFGGGPLWCAKCTYLSAVADAISSTTINGDKKSDIIVVRFFGLFFVFYQMAQVWGNLISSSVLTFTSVSDTITDMNITSVNYYLNDTITAGHGYKNDIVTGNAVDADTIVGAAAEALVNRPHTSTYNDGDNSVIIKNVGEMCGANFCPGVSALINPNLIPPEPEQIQMLSGIFLACMILACLLVVFGVDSLKRYGVSRRKAGNGQTGCELLAVTVKLLSERYQLLLLPITMFIGAEEAFIAVDFTASFVACGWGISRIGFAMICFGIANAIAAGIAGALAKLVGRISIMISVFILHAGLLIWMHEWTPIENDYITYCTMAALWGIADGLWLVNVNAFSGILFPGKEIAAYSNFRLWESTGSVIGYSLSAVLCTSTKLRGLLCLMIIGVLGYFTIEFIERKEKGSIDRRNIELVSQNDDNNKLTSRDINIEFK